tara:strand:- start:46 stop:774 length:729 start_codon:yes stop_codon:yes gene_type:complete
MKSITNKVVASALSDFTDSSISTKKTIEAFASVVFSNLDDSDKKEIVELANAEKFSEAKVIIKSLVSQATDFNNKNTLGSFKRSIAPKYYDEKKSVTIIRKHKDNDSGIDYSGDKVIVTQKMAYEKAEVDFKALKNKTGKYLSDGVDIHAVYKLLRNKIKGDVDKVTSDFTARITKQVEILLGINTVTGTQQALKIALHGKLEKLNEYYFNNNETLETSESTLCNKEWKAWISSAPKWIKKA